MVLSLAVNLTEPSMSILERVHAQYSQKLGSTMSKVHKSTSNLAGISEKGTHIRKKWLNSKVCTNVEMKSIKQKECQTTNRTEPDKKIN